MSFIDWCPFDDGIMSLSLILYPAFLALFIGLFVGYLLGKRWRKRNE